MNLKKSLITIQNKKAQQHLDSRKDYPTIADLMREQKVENNTNTVHHRRDLDSLG